MGWFKKVFRKSKCKKISDHSKEKEGQNDAADQGNDPEPEGVHGQPEENKDDPEENTNQVAPTSPDREPPPHRPDEPDYQPWSIYGSGGWRPAGYHQQEDYHMGGRAVCGGEASGHQSLGGFSHPPQYIDHRDRSCGRYTRYDQFAWSSGQVNNYWSPPRMPDYDTWNRGQYVKSDHDVWTSDYWQGLFQPPQGGWS